jgi:hypothetical protein
MMKFLKTVISLVIVTALIVCVHPCLLFAQQTPITEQHILAISNSFAQNGLTKGRVVLDRYGRVELKGEYYDEKEVDRAFSLAQTVVGVKWVSPVTPENIKVKEWERRLSNLFSRAKVLKPTSTDRGGEAPGPVQSRYALVAGVGTFKNGIQPLQYAVRDATSFYGFLINPAGARFPRENVAFLTDQNATRGNITAALDRIRSLAQPDDLVTIYVSSHGTPPDKFGGVHVVTYDTEVKPRENVWHTALTESILKEFIETLRAKRLVMILDTCYSNGAYRSVPGFLPPGGKSLGANDEEGYGISKDYGKRLLGSKDIVLEDGPRKDTPKSLDTAEQEEWGKVLVSASGAGEKSWESDSLQNSVFTYYFLDGLNRNDGSIKNAFFYAKPLVYQRVKQEKGADIDQNPQVMATSDHWNMRLSAKKK